MSGVGVEAILAGELPLPAAWAHPAPGGRARAWAELLRPGGETLTAPCLAFLIRHPEHGLVLVDTGFHPRAREGVRKEFGLAGAVMFRGLRVAGTFDAQLRERGVAPEDVELVAMTHLHSDHTSGMRLLERARFVCDPREWAWATGRGGALGGAVAHHLPPPGRVRRLDLEREGEPFGPFSRTIDVFADGAIRLVSTPGHTPGHLSVLLPDVGGRPVLLAGDAAYTRRNVDEGVLPLLTRGDDAARRSLGELRAYAEAHPHALLVPTHDPHAWREL